MVILGINGALNWDGNSQDGWVHGSGVSLIIDDKWVGSICEERFTRIKYDGNFPSKSIQAILKQNNLIEDDVNIVAYTTTNVNSSYNPENKLKIKSFFKTQFKNSEVCIIDHHNSHSACSFLTSPFSESNIFTIDNAGDVYAIENTLLPNYGSFGFGLRDPFSLVRIKSLMGDDLNIKHHNRKKLSIGLYYNAMSNIVMSLINSNNFQNLVYNHNSRESSPGKVMGLSAYGKKINLTKDIFKIDQQSIYEMPDISLRINFLDNLFLNELYNQKPEDLALWTQEVFEDTLLNFLQKIPKGLKKDNLCFSGGSALNILLNSKIISNGLFKDVHIPTAPNDDGLSLGGALLVAYEKDIKVKLPKNIGCVGNEYKKLFSIKNKFSYEDESLQLENLNLLKVEYNDTELLNFVSEVLKNNKIVAWFQGKSEFGPRALGNRSILANPCYDNKQLLNEKVKFREYWRPYAAVVLQEQLNDWFDCPKKESHYMLFSSFVKEEKKVFIPAVVHKDNTCRIQTVTKEINERLFLLLQSFYEKTNVPLLLNTSFNTIPGEPIVETPGDAIKSFIASNIDVLVINNTVITKKQ